MWFSIGFAAGAVTTLAIIRIRKWCIEALDEFFWHATDSRG